MREAYLTIDDSPSPHTDALTDFLVERGVPAILFLRGDMTEIHGCDALVRAVDKGIVLGNHAWSHNRASEKPFEFYTADIQKTETVIDRIYAEAGVPRGRKYFRFPHIDRGTGGWIMDYDALGEKDRADVIAVFSDGLNINLTPPTSEMIEKKARLQKFLKAEGYSRFPSENVTFPWYQGELAEAIDVPYTYSTADWMLLDRHRGKWPYKTLDDLKRKIDQDPWLRDENSHHIILAHDKDQIETVIRDLVDYCLAQEIEFLPIP
jgi:peptidoglycan/xylan/chitin deacetylase (PgdA/CDA1 family)